MHVIFAGSGEFGLPTLKGILEAGHEIVGVFTQPDRPAGRGRKLSPTSIGQFALEQSLPLARVEDLNQQPLPPADLMVVIAFGQKISPQAAAYPRLGSVNLHASLLPKYRGAAPINWALMNGETLTGNSVIRLAQKMDAGAILGQSEVAIGPLETAGELHDRLALNGKSLVLRVMSELEANQAAETPQDDSRATLAPKLNREAAQIDWNSPAASIAAKIRGLYPWPGCRVKLVDAAHEEQGRLILVRARPTADEGSRWDPGEIELSQSIRAGDGAVEIIELQPEGKRPMSLADYRRGHPWMPGMRLGSMYSPLEPK